MHKHQIAIDLLRKELCKIAGEIFEKTFLKECLKIQSENGNEEAKKELNMLNFMNNLLNTEEFKNNKDEEKFHSIKNSILFLSEDK